MIMCQPILDLDDQETMTAARLSVFMDAGALQTMIETAMKPESEDLKEAAKGKQRLLQTFIVRGLFNMTKILKAEFTEFLQRFDLLKNFISFLLKNTEEKRN